MYGELWTSEIEVERSGVSRAQYIVAEDHGMHHSCIRGNCGSRETPLSAADGNERRGTSLITAGRVEGLRETEKTCGNHEEQGKQRKRQNLLEPIEQQTRT